VRKALVTVVSNYLKDELMLIIQRKTLFDFTQMVLKLVEHCRIGRHAIRLD
jgi:hypothetical protein